MRVRFAVLLLLAGAPACAASSTASVGASASATAGASSSASATSASPPGGASALPLANGPRKITAGGVALHVDVEGSGPPCLYVHGGPGQGAQSFQHMRGDALESFLTMLYVDQRGAGQSDTASDYSLERVVDDLDEVRRALRIDKLYVLSHSFGGVIAFRYAEKYPDHVLGLILANSTLYFPGALRNQLAYIRQQVGDTSRTADDAPWTTLRADFDRGRQKLWARSDFVPLLVAHIETMQALRQVDSDPPRKQELGTHVISDPRASDYLVDFTPRTRNVQVPVLIITGDHDHAIGPDHYKLFHFPHQTVHHIDGSHLLYYENSPAFVAAIRDWVTARTAMPAK